MNKSYSVVFLKRIHIIFPHHDLKITRTSRLRLTSRHEHYSAHIEVILSTGFLSFYSLSPFTLIVPTPMNFDRIHDFTL